MSSLARRALGATGLTVPVVAFGAGPVAGLLTGEDERAQTAVVARALELGVDWFDTAATYGDGRSEQALGAALARLGRSGSVGLATKVRIAPDQVHDIRDAVRLSVDGSLRRLKVAKLDLLQVHNSITRGRGDEPTSLTPADVLGPLLSALEELRAGGVLGHLGLTGLGDPESLRRVLGSGRFETIQIPCHLLHALRPGAPAETSAGRDWSEIIAEAAELGLGVFAIRVYAGGALLDRPPSPHTLRTPFFPLPLYERHRELARDVAGRLPQGLTVQQAAVRYVVGHRHLTAAIVGFGRPAEVDDAVAAAASGPLRQGLLETLRQSS